LLIRVSDNEVILPNRFQVNVKSATVLIYSKEDEFSRGVGIGFFITPNRLVTANHILHEHYAENEEIHIGVHNQQGDLEHKTVFAIHTHIEWDLSVLFFAEDHHAWLQLPALDSMPISHRIAVTSFSSTLFEELGGTIDASFCVIPGIIVKLASHHVLYSSTLFSGDSGGAVILSSDGVVRAIHQETVNQAKELGRIIGIDGEEETDDLDENSPMPDENMPSTIRRITRTVNSLVSGLSQGFIGLRLDRADIQAFIMQNN
jgi:hypothetical protein